MLPSLNTSRTIVYIVYIIYFTLFISLLIECLSTLCTRFKVQFAKVPETIVVSQILYNVTYSIVCNSIYGSTLQLELTQRTAPYDGIDFVTEIVSGASRTSFLCPEEEHRTTVLILLLKLSRAPLARRSFPQRKHSPVFKSYHVERLQYKLQTFQQPRTKSTLHTSGNYQSGRGARY